MFRQGPNIIRTIYTPFLLSLLIIASCDKTAPVARYQVPENLYQYVAAFTSGYISSTSPIQIQFVEDQVDPTAIGTTATAGLLSFSPRLSGTLTWETPNTLRFEPENPLASGKQYTATLHLDKIIDQLPEDLRKLEFAIQAKEQFFNVHIGNPESATPEEPGKQIIKGWLTTYDVAALSDVQQVLSAFRGKNRLDLSWTEGSDRQQFYFTLSDIQRTENPSDIRFQWDGAPLKVEKKGEKVKRIASINDFSLSEVQYHPSAEGYLSLLFTDPLSEDQNLEGLIAVADYDGVQRHILSGHEIRVYFDRPIRGETTVRISEHIQNYAGKKLAQAASWNINFEQPEPQVRISGSGTILPNSEALTLSFETIDLQSVVVEVFKIHQTNILQFLQTNQLSGDYELYRVGKIIHRKVVALDDTADEEEEQRGWKRHLLDLKPLIDEDPAAIFQVRIGFMPEDALYFCGADVPSSPSGLRMPGTTELNEQSIMDLYYGPSGYSDDYNWEDRDDPCKAAYFNSNRFVSRNILASNLGISAKSGTDKTWWVAVADLRDVAPLQGVAIGFYDYQLQLIQTAITGNDGTASVKLSQTPHFIVATSGKQKGYLKLADGESLSFSKFDVEGTFSQEGIKGFLYAERGVWRPGDSIFLHFILADKHQLLPENYPVSIEVRDARGQVHYKKNAAAHQLNIYPFHFATPPDAPTGRWLARVTAGSATFDKVLSIENIKPNRLKIDLQLNPSPQTGKSIPGTLAARWLQGAAAQGLKARVEYKLSSVATTFPTHRDFVFDDPIRALTTETQTAFDGVLDPTGNAGFSIPVGTLKQAPGKLRLGLKTTVFEPGGNFSTDNQSIGYDPFDSYAGIRIPANEWDVKQFETDKDFYITLASLGKNGSPVSDRPLQVDIYAVNWRWWWEQGTDGDDGFIVGANSNNVYSKVWNTDNKGEKKVSIQMDTPGRYFVRVCDPVSGHCTGDYFYAGMLWDSSPENKKDAAQLPIQATKTDYAIGEEVSLVIQGGQGGKALVSLENGSRVIRHFWQDLQQGANTIRFKTTSEMSPNIYAHITLLQGHGQVINDLPLRLYGVFPIRVNDPATRLQPVLWTPATTEPNRTFTIEVSEKSKQEMAYTLALVDEGLLGLTRFQTPDPHQVFSAKEALGVKTWDSYDDVLGAHGIRMSRLISVGGDGSENINPSPDNPNRFKPVVTHLGPFVLPKGKTASHKITLPNYVGEVRVMLVAANARAYGSAEAKLPVQQPLMVLPTLPRVLRPGDQLDLPVNVFVMNPTIRQVSVQLEASGGLLDIEAASRTLSFTGSQEKMTYFRIKVRDKTGIAKVKVQAKGNGYEASETIEIAVLQPNPPVAATQAGLLNARGDTWTANVDPVGITGTNQAILEVSTLPALNLSKHLDYLVNYPYGCVEQTISAAFPQLFLDRLLPLDASRQKKITENLLAAINRLKFFQTSQGGFGYWPEDQVADPWGTTYAGHFLLEAKNKGYAVPEYILRSWIRFQRSAARNWVPDPASTPRYNKANYELEQAYRLFTLALAGEPELAAMNLMRLTEQLSIQAKWRLAAAYALLGQTEAAKQLIADTSTDVSDYREMAFTYGSRLRDRSMILESLVLLGEWEATRSLVDDIAGQLSGSGYLSTQEAGYALLALSKFAGESDVLSKGFSFTYTLGTKSLQVGSDGPVFQLLLPDAETRGTLTVSSNSDKKLFTRLLQSGVPAAGNETAAANGLQLEVTYEDAYGKAIDPGSLPQSTDFFAKITVRNPAMRSTDYANLALTHIFPSGWEILNTRLEATGDLQKGSTPDYTDIRDDRVHLFFDLNSGSSKTFYLRLNATYAGKYYLPAVTCSAMYDPGTQARTTGRWVSVVGMRGNQ